MKLKFNGSSRSCYSGKTWLWVRQSDISFGLGLSLLLCIFGIYPPHSAEEGSRIRKVFQSLTPELQALFPCAECLKAFKKERNWGLGDFLPQTTALFLLTEIKLVIP